MSKTVTLKQYLTKHGLVFDEKDFDRYVKWGRPDSTTYVHLPLKVEPWMLGVDVVDNFDSCVTERELRDSHIWLEVPNDRLDRLVNNRGEFV